MMKNKRNKRKYMGKMLTSEAAAHIPKMPTPNLLTFLKIRMLGEWSRECGLENDEGTTMMMDVVCDENDLRLAFRGHISRSRTQKT